jgi:hypothetical protein
MCLDNIAESIGTLEYEREADSNDRFDGSDRSALERDVSEEYDGGL